MHRTLHFILFYFLSAYRLPWLFLIYCLETPAVCRIFAKEVRFLWGVERAAYGIKFIQVTCHCYVAPSQKIRYVPIRKAKQPVLFTKKVVDHCDKYVRHINTGVDKMQSSVICFILLLQCLEGTSSFTVFNGPTISVIN
jgi:hypothetical protein